MLAWGLSGVHRTSVVNAPMQRDTDEWELAWLAAVAGAASSSASRDQTAAGSCTCFGLAAINAPGAEGGAGPPGDRRVVAGARTAAAGGRPQGRP
jgi:hypothetical protein